MCKDALRAHSARAIAILEQQRGQATTGLVLFQGNARGSEKSIKVLRTLVMPTCRKGSGTVLLQALLQATSETCAKYVVEASQCTKELAPFYLRCGFMCADSKVEADSVLVLDMRRASSNLISLRRERHRIGKRALDE